MAKQKSLPEGLASLLDAEDARKGFPMGTMRALMNQEIGGNSKFLDDPSAYHYGLNAEGRRVAGHTGKVSTAFGPFGILESTARQPGYGVAPLKDKSIGEQMRFAADYLKARAGNGSLEQGLSNYGEGPAYGKQVMARLGNGGGTGGSGGQPTPQQAQAQAQSSPVQQAASFDPLPVQVLYPGAQQATPMGNYALSSSQGTPDQPDWQDFQRALPSQRVFNALSGYGAQPQQVAGNQYPAGQDSDAARALWRVSLG